jgi:hypothetical protein
MYMMINEYICAAKWSHEAAQGELLQAKQSLLWAEESAEKRKVDKKDDTVVHANITRVDIAGKRLISEQGRLSRHDCSTSSICAISQNDKNGS